MRRVAITGAAIVIALGASPARAADAAATPAGASAAPVADGPAIRLDCPERMTIGDSCRLSVEVAAAPGDRLEVPRQPELGPAIEVEAQPVSRTPDARRLRAAFELRCWATGTISLPGLTLRLVPAAGPVRELEIPALTVEVTALLPEGEQQARPFKGPVELRVPRYWPLGAAAAVLLAVIALVGWLRSRRRRTQAEPEQPLPDHELAMSRLEALRDEQLVAAGRAGEHFNRVAWILREYIEARYRLARPPAGPGALQRTRSELITALGERARVAPHTELLGAVLGQCDRVRFGKRPVQPDEADHHIGRAIQFVKATRPAEAPGRVTSAARGAGGGA